MIVDIDGPVHEHDCDGCKYLGSIAALPGATGGQPADLYVCGGEFRSLISRTGKDGDYLSMPLRTYSTGMRVRLAMGVVTSIDPEILLLDEGIGAVDAEFMKKARTRLQDLVARSGILVFASHSNEFLAQLCTSAMWIDHGTIRMTGGIEEVVGAYEGPDAARHGREVLEENSRADG